MVSGILWTEVTDVCGETSGLHKSDDSILILVYFL